MLLLKIVNTIKASKEKRGNELLDESSLLDKQIQLQEKEVEKLRLQAQIQYQVTRENELERRDRELDREREREREARERAREAREREREAHEWNVLKLKKGLAHEQFNVSTAMKLVPLFDEKNVAEFFVAFEKIANKLEWPKPMWTTLLQCRLIGKVQKVHVALKDDLRSDYDSIKEIVLK